MKYIKHDMLKFVYFVNQKVACSSIKEALINRFAIDLTPYRFINRWGVERLRIHRAFDESNYQFDANEIAELFENGSLGDYFKFGFVRNPWDRLVSCYSQKIERRKKADLASGSPLKAPPDNPKAFYLGMPFEDFVEVVADIPDDEADPHFRSQYPLFHDRQGASMADYVGRFENLSADFESAMKTIGIERQCKLPHVLKNPKKKKKPAREYYDEHTRKLVEKRFASDIDSFGYSFDDLR